MADFWDRLDEGVAAPTAAGSVSKPSGDFWDRLDPPDLAPSLTGEDDFMSFPQSKTSPSELLRGKLGAEAKVAKLSAFDPQMAEDFKRKIEEAHSPGTSKALPFVLNVLDRTMGAVHRGGAGFVHGMRDPEAPADLLSKQAYALERGLKSANPWYEEGEAIRTKELFSQEDELEYQEAKRERPDLTKEQWLQENPFRSMGGMTIPREGAQLDKDLKYTIPAPEWLDQPYQAAQKAFGVEKPSSLDFEYSPATALEIAKGGAEGLGDAYSDPLGYVGAATVKGPTAAGAAIRAGKEGAKALGRRIENIPGGVGTALAGIGDEIATGVQKGVKSAQHAFSPYGRVEDMAEELPEYVDLVRASHQKAIAPADAKRLTDLFEETAGPQFAIVDGKRTKVAEALDEDQFTRIIDAIEEGLDPQRHIKDPHLSTRAKHAMEADVAAGKERPSREGVRSLTEREYEAARRIDKILSYLGDRSVKSGFITQLRQRYVPHTAKQEGLWERLRRLVTGEDRRSPILMREKESPLTAYAEQVEGVTETGEAAMKPNIPRQYIDDLNAERRAAGHPELDDTLAEKELLEEFGKYGFERDPRRFMPEHIRKSVMTNQMLEHQDRVIKGAMTAEVGKAHTAKHLDGLTREAMLGDEMVQDIMSNLGLDKLSRNRKTWDEGLQKAYERVEKDQLRKLGMVKWFTRAYKKGRQPLVIDADLAAYMQNLTADLKLTRPEKLVRKFNSLWAPWVLFSGGFISRNAQSNLVLQLQGWGPEILKHQGTAMAMAMGADGPRVITLANGNKIRTSLLRKVMKKNGLWGVDAHGIDISELTRWTEGSGVAKGIRKLNPVRAAKKAGAKFRDISMGVENQAKSAAFIQSLMDIDPARFTSGMSRTKRGLIINIPDDVVGEAVAKVNKWLFNYAELSQLDRRLKVLFPFWTWTRKNLPLQARLLAKHPQLWEHWARVQMAQPGAADRPEYLKEKSAFSLPTDEFGIGRVLAIDMPIAEPLKALDPEQWLSSMTPVLTTVYQLARGRDRYGRKIDDTGEFLGSKVGGLYYYGKVAKRLLSGEGTPLEREQDMGRMIRFLTGFGLHTTDVRTKKKYEIMDEKKSVTKALKKAVEGQKEQ